MTPREIFHRYAAERRHAPIANYRLDAVPHLTRYTPLAPDLEGIVMFAELSSAMVDEAIATQIEYFRGLDRVFEWKTYDFDAPSDLPARLQARGFVPSETEGFLVFPVASHQPRAPKGEGHAIRIERITTIVGIRQVARLQEEIWSQSLPWLEDSLRTMLDHAAIYCAFAGDKPIGNGWIKFPPATGGAGAEVRATFADLHGGSVLPAYRGRGVYTALFDIRVAEAKRRGFDFLAVDTSPMSRPILLAKGFTFVCETIPFRKAPDSAQV